MKRVITEKDIKDIFSERPKDCNKGDFGYVALIGGSIEYSGAIRLAAMANAAMRSGAGVATVAAPRSICPIIAGQILEATIIPLSDNDGRVVFVEEEFDAICNRYDCIAFGMGIGNSEETVKAVEYLITQYEKTLIIDADGLNAMSEIDKKIVRESRATLVLTPHLKEFSRLSGLSIDDIKANPEESACVLANELNAAVLLKGSTSIVAEPKQAEELEHPDQSENQRVFLIDRGTPGMATAGSGDVLSGILASICFKAKDLTLAVSGGAYINGVAGEIAEEKRSEATMTASDTALCIAEAIERLI